ncbi:MAG: hypothetical protein AVDCRST_MAG66-2589, partial [uncultured Pseudonocardia sp.]
CRILLPTAPPCWRASPARSPAGTAPRPCCSTTPWPSASAWDPPTTSASICSWSAGPSPPASWPRPPGSPAARSRGSSRGWNAGGGCGASRTPTTGASRCSARSRRASRTSGPCSPRSATTPPSCSTTSTTTSSRASPRTWSGPSGTPGGARRCCAPSATWPGRSRPPTTEDHD